MGTRAVADFSLAQDDFRVLFCFPNVYEATRYCVQNDPKGDLEIVSVLLTEVKVFPPIIDIKAEEEQTSPSTQVLPEDTTTTQT